MLSDKFGHFSNCFNRSMSLARHIFTCKSIKMIFLVKPLSSFHTYLKVSIDNVHHIYKHLHVRDFDNMYLSNQNILIEQSSEYYLTDQ